MWPWSMTEQDNTGVGLPTHRHPHDIPDLPTLRGIRSIPRIKRDRDDLAGFELDHDALRDIREMSRRIADLRQSQAELLYPMYRAGVSTFMLSKMTGLSRVSVIRLVRQSHQLDPDTPPMPDQADDEFYDYEPSPYDGTYSEE